MFFPRPAIGPNNPAIGPNPNNEVSVGRVLTIPTGVPLRVVGDVHGDATAFAYAAATERFVVQLGDLTDGGPDNAGALRIMFGLIDERRGLFLIGNHDLKLARALSGQDVRIDAELERTMGQLDPALRERLVMEVQRAPHWLRHGPWLFVHGGFHTDMMHFASPPAELRRPTGPVSRSLFGQPTGRVQPDGYPERSLRWVDRIPRGLTVYCGHDRRSRNGRPCRRSGALGGEAVFVDTGAGKGGHLSWIDLAPAG